MYIYLCSMLHQQFHYRSVSPIWRHVESCHQSIPYTYIVHVYTEWENTSKFSLTLFWGLFYNTMNSTLITNRLFLMLTSAPLLMSNSTRDFLLEAVAQCYMHVWDHRVSVWQSQRQRWEEVYTRGESMVSMCWKEVRVGVQVRSFFARLTSPLSAAFRSW